ncbi:SpoIID/LytB domain-containing protein [Natronogracilivirga saccharolytica]|uniref:SpoIID/LytB domain-containing protein n=1 Tax=Natronogracilivirga saccharolytica TaxID=2812953 RepID=A0A8J7UUA4_9BACT|nr:SpoIID/LytB domain-containing protein [Natronogracilivirga saccharolytica]MBP3191297.1 SpoIID/LytB domain-containing protein [Natronogracilivirga saccharolytica]
MPLYKIISAGSLPALVIITSMLFSGCRSHNTYSLSGDIQQEYPDTDEEALITDLNGDGYMFPEEPAVRVLLINTLAEFVLQSSGKVVISGSGQEHEIPAGSEIRFQQKKGELLLFADGETLANDVHFRMKTDSSFTIRDVPYGINWWWGGREDRIYQGELNIYTGDEENLKAVLHLPMERYMKGVVPYEIGPESPLGALKAQSVAARTEIVQALLTGKYEGEHYDVCAEVECQVFAGDHRRSSRSDSSVTLTRGEVLEFEGAVADAYYASNCGGKSERVEKVWPWRSGPKPYLVSGFDQADDPPTDPQDDIETWLEEPPESWCNPYIHTDLPEWSKANFRWEREIADSDFTEDFRGLDSLEIIERGESGRLHRIRAWKNGEAEKLDYELAIRQMVKPPLRSSAFVYSRTDTSWVFRGAGWGHGVGMCQSGAISQINSGYDYRQVIDHYFPGTSVVTVYR